MSDHEHWQLDGDAAELYERYLVPAITLIWAADIVGRVKPAAGEQVLDVACGTGAVTRLVPKLVGHGRVVGLDCNPDMLAVARSVHKGTPEIEWREGSALNLPFGDGSFDVVLSQLGLQFFPDRLLALGEMRRVLRPGGRVALSVFGPIERTPAAFAFARALDHHLGADASKTKRAEHIFTEPEELEILLSSAGLKAVEVSVVTKRITFPSVLHYVRFQLIATPQASLLGAMDGEEREAMVCQIAVLTQSRLDPKLLSGGRLSFPQEAFVMTAGKID
jgi:ubiquinone/menaquinone biosynthesis C-methylase UbiE